MLLLVQASHCAPPMIVTEAHVDEIVDAVGKALDKTLNYVKKEGLLATAA